MKLGILATLPLLFACANSKVTPVQNQLQGQNPIQLELVARHISGQYGEGAAEVVAYQATQQKLYVVNGAAKAIDIVSIKQIPQQALALPYSGQNLASTRLSLPNTAETAAGQLTLKSPNSLAIHGDLMAVAMQNKDKQANGAILFYDLSAQQPSLIKAVEVGALPDMVAFTPDGSKVVVANEGEPSKDYRNDPEGSISIIETGLVTGNGISQQDIRLNFQSFNSKMLELKQSGVKFASPKGTSVAQDLEPEYVAISADSTTAYVTLQENNAIAIVDLTKPAISSVKGLGYKDWNQYTIDVSDKDGAQLNRYENLYGLYQPDTIYSYQVNGKTYLLTANEGDAREYIYDANEADCKAAGHKFDDEDGCISYSEEVRAKKLSFKSPSIIDSYYDKNGIGRLKVTKVLGDDDGDGYHEKLYAYGARSFSIWDSEANQVFDSGDHIAKTLLQTYGEQFNANESKNNGDNRSDDKGAEPEALTVAKIGNRYYGFIGLERMGGIMVYDITNPQQPQYLNFINNRDMSLEFKIDDDTDPVTLKGNYDKVGDLAPEGMVFISAEQSPTGKPLLAVANEVSGSLSIYQIR
ncbi:MAG: alkaline phosphatase [Kangiellaceae bacterium]|nr:alkaline phosphatase [Kangiellaceae bacterium]